MKGRSAIAIDREVFRIVRFCFLHPCRIDLAKKNKSSLEKLEVNKDVLVKSPGFSEFLETIRVPCLDSLTITMLVWQ